MKKLFIALIVAMCCVTAAVLGASRAFGIMNEEGFAMPASAGIVQSLAGGGSSEPISLVKVQYEDVIYSSLTGYYVGQDRQQIDLTYPLYTNGGAGLHFLGDDVWLITPNVDLYQSFDGLYLSNGTTYNSDMMQADEGEEFIFLALSNGLYMNAEQAVFTTALGSTVIPTNSILRLSEDSICWYEQKNGTLASCSEQAVFGATLTIGEHTYQYIDLLDALGLVREAVKDNHTNKPDEDKLQEAEEILNGKDGQNGKKPGVNHGAGDQNGQLPGGRADDQIEGGNQDGDSAGTESGQHNGDQGPQDAQDNGERPDEPDDTQGDAGDSTAADDTGKDHAKGDTAGSGTNTDHSNSGTSSGGSGSGSGSSGSGSGGSGSSGSGGSSGSSGSTGSSGSGGSSGSSGSTGSGDTSGENPGGDGKSDGGNSDNVPYQQPEVTLSDIQLWSYGLGIHMRVNDPSGVIVRGVNFTVYKSVKGSGETHTDAQGRTIYPSDTYEGKSSLLRKNKAASSQEFALSTLQPGQTVYLQYSYRYNAEEKDPDSGETKIKRRPAYSNLIEIKIPTVEEGGVKAVSSDWTVSYAARSDGMVLSGLTLANTANYDKDASYSFDNFKLNTLPYVGRMEFTMTPESGGEPVTVSVGSSVLTRAQQEGGTGFTSTSPKLDSNRKYTCTKVVVKDRYGNEIPLETTSIGQAVYTRKAAPVVTITEKENVMDSLTIGIKVSDPDHALKANTPLRLVVVNNQTKVPADLYGQWNTADISEGGENVQMLELKNPADGREYELELDSLAFSCLYAVEVSGDYVPQPDVQDAPGTLADVSGELLGSVTVYTAALSSGRISFTTGVENLLDTSATVTATMTSDTTIDILPLVDEFRVIVKDKQGNTVSSATLAESELSDGDKYAYDQSTASVMLQEGNHLEPTVTLNGRQDQYSQNPWNSFLIHETYDADTQQPNGYSSPMALQVALPALEHFTEYTFSIQAVVIKSGQEYQIPVSITNNRFMTKKTLPTVQYSDLFLAADVAEFLNLKVYDPDGTILNDGAITIYLYYGNTLLSSKQITADQTGDAEGVNVRFDGLISGGQYQLQFVASAYNDAEGFGSYKTNYTMKVFDLVAGSALSGKVNVASLQANSEGSFDAALDITVTDTMGYLGREGEKAEVTLTIERSDSMEQPDYKPFKTEVLPLTKNADGSLSLDLTGENAYALDGISARDGWRVTLSAIYKGSEVLLNQITFRTDADYVSVSTHAELLAAQRANPRANILVTSDFEQDQNVSPCAFYGTIDFQGHVVTKKEGITNYFLTPQPGSKITNLVYDYPDSTYYVNSAAICYALQGTMENIMVRTRGSVEVTAGYRGLIAHSVSADGTLRNFIVRLGGDLICSTEGSNYGGLVTYVSGLMENGYVYGVNGAGFIGRGYSGDSGLFVYTYYNGVIRNMYTVMDSWYQSGGNAYLMTPVNEAKHTFYNIYSVGDYYNIGAGENKNYLLPSSTMRIHGGSAGGLAFQNTWALTSRDYDTDKLVERSSTIKLHDQEWQNSVLNAGAGGGAFDVDGCVPMDFYPRLILPTCMQRHQEYLPLPSASDSRVPKIVSDSWADEAIYGAHGLDDGYIKLRFQNDSGAIIQSVDINGLISEVMDQKAVDGGMYDVVLKVQVDTDASKANYVSAYKVTQFTYTDASATRTAASSYVTSGIDFWKEIKTPSDWAEINKHMGWNYKLTADLDFANTVLTPGEVMINGGTSITSIQKFTGRLDGQEHVLSGIRLENLSNPYLVYFAEGAEIRNLLVDDAVISAGKSVRNNYCGLIGRADKSRLENIRVRNSHVTGGGYLGILVGYVACASMEGCSAADSTLTDIEVGTALYAGGLIGYGTNATEVRSCYTYNVDMDITHTTVINCVGGLAGYFAASPIESCYTNGTIKTNGSFVGGINGSVTTGDATYLRRSWSYVDILQTSGDYAGGISGLSTTTSNSIALGNVAGAGANANRIAGKIYGGIANTVYAYKDQVAGQLTDKGDATGGLLSGDELGRADTWQDTIRLGADWNYSPVNGGCAPKLKNDCGRDGWQQQDVFLPGQSSDPTLRVDRATYDETNGYYLEALLTHPGVTSGWIQEAYKNGSLTLSLDGMDLSDAAQHNGNAAVKLGSTSGDDADFTVITITTKEKEKALNTYALNVKYKDGARQRDLTAMVTYLNSDGTPHISYWEIPDLATWNEKMKDHGQTGENFKITGVVDFAGSSTEYKELVLSRLEGENSACGFANLNYNGGTDALPWITKIGLEMKNLTFTNMTFNFSASSYTRSMTGAILNVSDASCLSITGLTMQCGRDTRAYFAFISTAGGTVDGVEMQNILVQDMQSGGSRYSYTGGLIAYSTGGTNNVHAENVQVLMPMNSYVGGIQGDHATYGQNFQGNTIKTFTVSGYNQTGGLMGTSRARRTTGDSAEDGTVTGNAEVGGLFGSTYTTGENTSYHKDLRVIKVDVTAAGGCAGGVAGVSGRFCTSGALVQGCSVKGTSFVGGYLGSNNNSYGTMAVENLQIVDCTVENTRTDISNASNKTTGTGGVIGSLFSESSINLKGITVRNTSVTGPLNVGGFLGTSYRPLDGATMDRIYIAEDVTVTSTHDIAGGMVGYCDRIKLTNSACGATVTANGSEAGGIIGHAEPQFDAIRVTLDRVYFKGTVTASDYAGGIIGKLNSNSYKTTDDNMASVLVAADVRSGGEGSLWINDTASTGDAGTGYIYICEDSLLNGQSADALIAAAQVQDATTYVVPKRTDNVQLLVPAEKFGDESFYKAAPKDGGAGFASGSWDYTDLSIYMPFTKNYNGTSILTYTNHASDGETAAGILVPKAGAVGQKTVVYASGVGTVNIEKAVPEGQDSVTVNVNGKDYATDANGVLTLNYNFQTDLTVDSVAYSAAPMTRKVMTSGNFWYYIGKDGLVHYGKAFCTSVDTEKAAKEMEEISTVAEVAGAVHLWQGRVLDASGNIYVLKSDAAGSTVTAEEDGTVTAELNLTALETAQPIWKDSTTQVYYYFSLYNGTPIPYRVFRHNGQAYTVSASQNTVYDGVVLSTKTEYGQDTRYFALLNNSGSITPYYSSMKLDTMRNSGIQYISNNLDYSGTVLLAYYEDGNVIGVDYHIGKQVCSTLSQAESFAVYAKNTIANIFSPGGWTLTVSDGSFYDGENFRDQLTEDGQYDSDGTAPITDSDDGQGGEEVSDSGESGGAQMPDGSTEAEGGMEVSGSDAVGGETAVSGSGATATNGEIAVNGDTAVSGDVDGGQGSSAAVPGSQAAQSGGSTAQAAANGAASSGSGTAAAPGSGSNGNSDGTAAGQTVEEAMKELFGSLLVAYSDSTGQYEVLDTASLAQGQQVRVADVLAHRNSADSADAAADSVDADSGADHSFSVAWGINRSLDTAERQGFVLIALAAGTGMIVLIALFCKVRRRKK